MKNKDLVELIQKLVEEKFNTLNEDHITNKNDMIEFILKHKHFLEGTEFGDVNLIELESMDDNQINNIYILIEELMEDDTIKIGTKVGLSKSGLGNKESLKGIIKSEEDNKWVILLDDGKLIKIEKSEVYNAEPYEEEYVTEMTDSGSSGSFEAPIGMVKKDIKENKSKEINDVLNKYSVKEEISGVHPAFTLTNQIKGEQKKINKEAVDDIIKDVAKTTITNIKGVDSKKISPKRENTNEVDDFVNNNRGMNQLDIKYDTEPSNKFKERLKKNLGEKAKEMLTIAKNKKEYMDNRPLYGKEPQPVENNKEFKKKTEMNKHLAVESIEIIKNTNNGYILIENDTEKYLFEIENETIYFDQDFNKKYNNLTEDYSNFILNKLNENENLSKTIDLNKKTVKKEKYNVTQEQYNKLKEEFSEEELSDCVVTKNKEDDKNLLLGVNENQENINDKTNTLQRLEDNYFKIENTNDPNEIIATKSNLDIGDGVEYIIINNNSNTIQYKGIYGEPVNGVIGYELTLELNDDFIIPNNILDFIKNNKNHKEIKESGINTFNTEYVSEDINVVKKLIPENFKVEGKEFEITDGIRSYHLIWENNDVLVSKFQNTKKLNEEINKMKKLSTYKSSTLNNKNTSIITEEEETRKIFYNIKELYKK